MPDVPQPNDAETIAALQAQLAALQAELAALRGDSNPKTAEEKATEAMAQAQALAAEAMTKATAFARRRPTEAMGLALGFGLLLGLAFGRR